MVHRAQSVKSYIIKKVSNQTGNSNIIRPKTQIELIKIFIPSRIPRVERVWSQGAFFGED